MALWKLGSHFSSVILLLLLQLWAHCCSHGAVGDPNIHVESVSVRVNGMQSIATVDESFICGTIDWWPPQKCDYGSCSWGNTSILNLDLMNPILQNAVTDGCLSMSRWQALNEFFQKTRSVVAFGLNALNGRRRTGSTYSGAWDSSNAQEFIQYTYKQNYPIRAWELGNELSIPGVGGSISSPQYAADVNKLRAIVDETYKTSPVKPLIVAPDGRFDASWYQQLLQVSGPKALDVCTRHIYNLGPGVDENLVSKILNPFYLDKEAGYFKLVQQTLQRYVDQLGMAAQFNNKVYCRQTLIGGNYGLLDTTSFHPNPDYYSALLWRKLMGRVVLSASLTRSPYIRAYAHCSKDDHKAIAVVLINLNNATHYDVDLALSISSVGSTSLSRPMLDVSGILKDKMEAGDTLLSSGRLEYHLTAPNGDIHSRTVLLNGNALQI
ncbi:hypothetical protein O6H91_Y155800 [Diphasiastrum complanatum]|nr:hypothetical protein O6H91_Y155800 [Diphasiastrum complanatum]